jgi:hypothetical protein
VKKGSSAIEIPANVRHSAQMRCAVPPAQTVAQAGRGWKVAYHISASSADERSLAAFSDTKKEVAHDGSEVVPDAHCVKPGFRIVLLPVRDKLKHLGSWIRSPSRVGRVRRAIREQNDRIELAEPHCSLKTFVCLREASRLHAIQRF